MPPSKKKTVTVREAVQMAKDAKAWIKSPEGSQRVSIGFNQAETLTRWLENSREVSQDFLHKKITM